MTARKIGRHLARLPLAPLLDAVGPIWTAASGARPEQLNHPNTPASRLAELADVSPRTVSRWHHIGVDEIHADHIACAIGLHPADIWGDTWRRTGLYEP